MGGCCSCGRKPKSFNLAKEAYARYNQGKNREDLTNALTLFETAREECPASQDKKQHSVILIKYASALYTQYSDFDQSAEDLAKVIKLDEEAFNLLENTPDSDTLAPEYEVLLYNLGDAYLRQYESFSIKTSFEKAIGKYKALQLRDKASQNLRRKGVRVMSAELIKWSEDENNEQGARKDKVDQAIDVLMTAKRNLGEPPSPAEDSDDLKDFRKTCLVNLALAHHSRYKIEKGSGKVDNAIPDLDQAIEYNREARAMLLVGQGLELVYCLSNLTQQLYDKYEYYLDRSPGHEHEHVDLDGALDEVKKVAEEWDSVVNSELEKTTDKEELEEIKQEIKDFLDKIKHPGADTRRPST